MDENIGRSITCCFTGHRPEKLPWGSDENDDRCLILKKRIYDIVEALYFSGIRKYICGMAAGCDMFYCEAVIKLREEHEDIELEAAVPCPSQSSGFSEAMKKRYQYLLSQCTRRTLVSQEYSRGCMMKRNMYMIDRSSVLIAVFDGQRGGTLQTIDYARRHKLEIIEIRP